MKKAIAIIILGLLLSGCAPLEAPVYRGMSKANYCDAKNFGAVFAMCNQKHVYYSNGIEVFNMNMSSGTGPSNSMYDNSLLIPPLTYVKVTIQNISNTSNGYGACSMIGRIY